MMVVRASLEEQLDPTGPIATRRGSVPVFLRKPIATYDFSQVGSGSPCPPPPPSGSTHVIRPCLFFGRLKVAQVTNIIHRRFLRKRIIHENESGGLLSVDLVNLLVVESIPFGSLRVVFVHTGGDDEHCDETK